VCCGSLFSLSCLLNFIFFVLVTSFIASFNIPALEPYKKKNILLKRNCVRFVLLVKSINPSLYARVKQIRNNLPLN
jgi:hypothetical protein